MARRTHPHAEELTVPVSRSGRRGRSRNPHFEGHDTCPVVYAEFSIWKMLRHVWPAFVVAGVATAMGVWLVVMVIQGVRGAAMLAPVAFMHQIIPVVYVAGASKDPRFDKEYPGIADRLGTPIESAHGTSPDTILRIPPRVSAELRDLRLRFKAVRDELGRTILDPMTMLECPAITDDRYPATAEVGVALDAAEAAVNGGAPDARRRVEELESAWSAAMDAAYAVGVNGLDIREVRRMEKLWATVTAPTGVTDAEQRRARDVLVGFLDRIVDHSGVHLSGKRAVERYFTQRSLPAPQALEVPCA